MRALVVGHGHMGRIHARALRDLGYDVETVDPAPDAEADHLEIPADGLYAAGAVAVPIPMLATVARQVAPHVNRLLIEKPMAASYDEALSLAADLDKRPVCVGFVERFNPQVRRLQEQLRTIGDPVCSLFTRWNDRETPDVDLDLRIHDLDLSAYLGLGVAECVFSTGYHPHHARHRGITVQGTNGLVGVNLMDHDTSPVHAMWHAFLTGRQVPTVWDAVNAHRALGIFRRANPTEAVAA